MSTPELNTFAWQGLEFKVPRDWALVKVQGKWESGFAALGGESGVRLQLRWDKAHPGVEPAAAASTYIREIRKQASKADAEIEVHRQLNLAGLKDADTDCYEWVSTDKGVGMVVKCENGRRMAHVVVFGERDAALRGLARKIFSSFKDYYDDQDDWARWAFYDVNFKVPTALGLKRSELKTGCIRLFFHQRSVDFEYTRASLAATLLKKKSLSRWFEDFYAGDLKPWRYGIDSAVWNNHQGIIVRGHKMRMLNPLSFVGHAKILEAAVWCCDSSNRIMALICKGVESKKETIASFVDQCSCCDI